MKFLTILSVIFFLPFAALALSEADVNSFEVDGKVIAIKEQQLEPAENAYQVVEVQVTSDGNYEGRTFEVDSRESLLEGLRYVVKENDMVRLMIIEAAEAPEPVVYITDMIRTSALLWLLGAFIVVLFAVGRWRGVTSLLGLAASLVVLFGFVLPMLLKGHAPLLITLIGAAALLFIAIFGTHGFRRESRSAFVSTIAGVSITALFATLFTSFARLTGLGTEDAAVLQLSTNTAINFHGLLLSGMILGAVGVLDDVAVTQAETVFELKRTNPELGRKELAQKAMRIGRHHIASVVNTLVLVYAGASLPLFILFYTADQSILHLINAEFIAEEVVRTLVGTIGLILTVPLTTWFASADATQKK